MAQLEAQAPDGKTLTIDVPEGTPESSYPQMVDEAVQHYSSLPGKLESFGRAAINNLPAGGQLGALGTAALKGTDYSQGMEEFNQKAAEAKAEHPIAYGAGAVTGSLAPLAIPGVGEAIAGAPALTGAGLGALNAVGNTDIVKQPEEAVKQGVEGGIVGGLVGKIIPSGKAAEEGLENYANRKTVEAARLPPGLLNMPREDIESLGNTMHEMGLDQGSIDDKVNIAASKLKEVGGQIGALGENIPPLQNAEPFINQLHDKIQESSDIFGAGANPEAPLYQAGIDKLSQPNLTFDQLQKMKSAIGERAFDSMGNVKNDAAANLYSTYKDAMKSMVEASPAEYQDLMDQYGDLLDINHALGKTRGIQNAGGAPAKGFGLAGKMGAMITGGNIRATAGLAAAIGPAHPFMGLGLASTIFTNPEAMATGARSVAGALPKAARAVVAGGTDAIVSSFIANPTQYGRYSQPLMQALQSGGKQGFAATSFVLRQQHPELNDMMMNRQDDNAE